MKKLNSKLFGAIAAIAFSGALQAQTVIYSENFESTSTGQMPANMTTRNKDGQTLTNFGTLLPNNAAWAVQNGSTVGGSYNNMALTSSYFTNTSVPANRWMITPKITLPALGGNNLVLQWDAVTFKSAPNYENYEILVSTTDTALASFTNVLTTVTNEATGGNSNTRNVSLNTYANQSIYIAFHYKSLNQYFLMIDNIKVSEVAQNDAALSNINVASYIQQATNVNVIGTITNQGSANLTAVDVNWNIDGGTVYTQTLSGLNVATYSTATFTHNTPLNIPNVGAYNLKVWVSNPNGQADPVNNNDTIKQIVNVVSTFPSHCVTIEEGTGTWCGWCVRGAVYMDSISKTYPNTTVLIAVHNADPMVVTNYDAGVGGMITGYPSALYNRKLVDDPSAAFTRYNEHINDFGFADLALNATYDVRTMKVTGNASANFATALNGDYRFAMVITENNVTGTASGYDQHNYYSYQSQNIPLAGAGHNWQTEPQIVPASRMKYDFVAREITGGFNGQAGSLPSSINSGSTYTYTLTSGKLTNINNPSKLKAHLLLFDAANKVILNGKSFNLTLNLYQYDGAIVSATVPTTVKTPKDTTIIVNGSIANKGALTMDSLYINWTLNGGTVHTQKLSSLNLATDATSTYTQNVLVSPTVAGNNKFKIWVSKPNGQKDSVPTNDTLYATIKVINTTGISNPTIAQEEVLGNPFPNPAVNVAYAQITNLNTNATLNILDISGKLVYAQALSAGTYKLSIDLKDLEAGTYFYQLVTNNNILSTKKLTVTK